MDTAILAGFSFGAGAKALVAAVKGKLLGHVVSRTGATSDEERVQAIWEFAPTTEQQHVRLFVGSTNWIRWYLSAVYATAVKILGEWTKLAATFPENGLMDARLSRLLS